MAVALSNSVRLTLSNIVLLQLRQQGNGRIGGRSSKNKHCFQPEHAITWSPQIVFSTNCGGRHRHRSNIVVSSISQGQEETQLEVEDVSEQPQEAAEDAEYVRQILRVLELLKEKRDMAFSEVRLTIMIEDPREAEQKRELGVEDARGCTREDMGAALVDVYEGRIPKDRVVLRELANEMLNWPKLETEVVSKRNPMQSPYAQATKTGVDPKVAAQRAKVDWDAATEIPKEDEKDTDDSLPPAVGFSVLYLITGLPIIIGVAVVLVLFLNSLQ